MGLMFLLNVFAWFYVCCHSLLLYVFLLVTSLGNAIEHLLQW